jgi:hypothetical protein
MPERVPLSPTEVDPRTQAVLTRNFQEMELARFADYSIRATSYVFTSARSNIMSLDVVKPGNSDMVISADVGFTAFNGIQVTAFMHLTNPSGSTITLPPDMLFEPGSTEWSLRATLSQTYCTTAPAFMTPGHYIVALEGQQTNRPLGTPATASGSIGGNRAALTVWML